MREKRPRLVVAFRSTTAAMAMEEYCQKNGVPGRLIPVPREITAGCGLAWSAPPEAREEVEKALCAQGGEDAALYELTI